MVAIILGAGLAGLSTAYFLKDKSIILEKENEIGGLCRSFEFNGIFYDIGPHILFSKNKKILNKLTSFMDTHTLRRSNKIFHKGKLIKYPFENDLAGLDKEDRNYCLREFLNNPYEDCKADNMLLFFLKIFGKGITELYLKPYNEKIWKYDPALMNIKMVERIPKPPREDVIKSAEGISTEGYKHQLYFQYPKIGGINQLIRGLRGKINNKSKIVNPVQIKKIIKDKDKWIVTTNKGKFKSDILINCMPIHEIFNYIEPPDEVKEALKNLKYNSIYIVIIQAKKDNIVDNFALNFADKDIIFHRISKLNFLGKNYCLKNKGSTIMAEITYRTGSYLENIDKEELKKIIINDLDKLNFVRKKDVIATDIKSFKYSYIIYDLDHKKNIEYILNYLLSQDIHCCGRFAEFEYLNMDAVVEHSIKLAEKLNNF